MVRTELTEFLERMAEEDLAEGADIYDHPCSVAVRALNQCFEDIKTLRNGLVEVDISKKSKEAQILIKLNYDPSW